ncbi:MAG: hypothetical protein LC679_19715 [Intrasporangiaceae bacterium]|nr:hypothetical protein [Intrasporangiaceae bacterium]
MSIEAFMLVNHHLRRLTAAVAILCLVAACSGGDPDPDAQTDDGPAVEEPDAGDPDPGANDGDQPADDGSGDDPDALLWDIDHPLATAGGGAEWKGDTDPSERLQQLLDADGYAIARVSCFKDTLVADARPELAVQDSATGGRWRGRSDFGWLNPYQQDAGQWCIDVGLAAIELGFHEVQFDYVRFPNGGDGDTSTLALPGVPADRPPEQWRHPEPITTFLESASDQIHAAGGLVAADLFGLVTYDFSWNGQSTGQVIEEIAEHVDVISPMVYPSHYGPGNYGLLPHPIEYPYETVWNAMQEAQMRTQDLRAVIRPWLEDFPAPWMGYDHNPGRVSDQMRATYENGLEGWMLWNAANRYSEAALASGPATSQAAAPGPDDPSICGAT